jgi:hypothetical protein
LPFTFQAKIAGRRSRCQQQFIMQPVRVFIKFLRMPVRISNQGRHSLIPYDFSDSRLRTSASQKVLHVDTGGLTWPTEKPPKTLPRGDWLTFHLPEEQFIRGLTFMLEEVSKHPFPTLALRSLRAGVETSTKERFFARPNWDVAKLLRDQFDAFRKKHSARG